MYGMLAQSYDAIGGEVIKSLIEHDMTGMRCYARDPFGKRMRIGYCSSKLILTNLYGHSYVERKYEKGVISVSVREFRTYALHISDEVK